jgi:type IV secretion system protein VirB1
MSISLYLINKALKMVGFVDMAHNCAPSVAIGTMAAIVKTESRFNPIAINVNVKKGDARPKFPASKTPEEATRTAKWLLSNGYNIDMGLGQINSANLNRLGVSVDDMFNPCLNINAAATILKGNYRSYLKDASSEQEALYAAISGYNTGSPTKGFKNGYVKAVISNSNVADLNSIDIHVPEISTPNKNVVTSVANNANVNQLNLDSPAVQIQKETTPEKRVMVYENGVEQAKNSVMVY